MAGLGLGYEVGQGEVGVGAGHEVGVVVVYEVLLHALGHASEHAYYEPLAAAARGVEGLEAVEYLLLGVVAHAARVEEYGVGFVEAVARVVAGHLHHGGHYFAVGHVHLAAVGFYV